MFFYSITAWSADLKDIYENLDVTSFNSSLRPMQISDEKLFTEFGQLPKPIMKDNEIIIEDEYWIYSIKIIKTNGNDIHVCFLDKSKEGNYDAQEPLVIRKYGKNYVAIAQMSDVCESYAR
ncbi:hypothetical protein HC729_12970 [Vibrio sp. S12_S33]|nr:hypothetical protein [Vibrio sp. S12_S33]